ncbi:MAG: DUF2267 domain-containing protein [Gemmatimonadota bacterium]
MSENAARQFLDQVQRETAVEDRQQALVGVRAVFYGLMAEPSRADLRRLAALFPEELETLWKPAFYTRLRDRREREGPSEEEFLERVRGRVRDGTSSEVDLDARRMSRVVLGALRSRLPEPDRATLDDFVPDDLEVPAGSGDG